MAVYFKGLWLGFTGRYAGEVARIRECVSRYDVTFPRFDELMQLAKVERAKAKAEHAKCLHFMETVRNLYPEAAEIEANEQVDTWKN